MRLAGWYWRGLADACVPDDALRLALCPWADRAVMGPVWRGSTAASRGRVGERWHPMDDLRQAMDAAAAEWDARVGRMRRGRWGP